MSFKEFMVEKILWLKEKYFRKSLMFVGGGIIGYLLNLLVTYILTEMFHVYYLFSYMICFAIINTIVFFINIKYVFPVKKKKLKSFIRYLISVVVFYCINVLSVKFLVEIMGLYYLWSMILVTGSLLVVKFFVYDTHVFTDK